MGYVSHFPSHGSRLMFLLKVHLVVVAFHNVLKVYNIRSNDLAFTLKGFFYSHLLPSHFLFLSNGKIHNPIPNRNFPQTHWPQWEQPNYQLQGMKHKIWPDN